MEHLNLANTYKLERTVQQFEENVPSSGAVASTSTGEMAINYSCTCIVVVGPPGIYPSDPSKTWRGKDDMLPPELSLRPLASSVAVSGPYGGLASESVGM